MSEFPGPASQDYIPYSTPNEVYAVSVAAKADRSPLDHLLFLMSTGDPQEVADRLFVETSEAARAINPRSFTHNAQRELLIAAAEASMGTLATVTPIETAASYKHNRLPADPISAADASAEYSTTLAKVIPIEAAPSHKDHDVRALGEFTAKSARRAL